MHKYSIEIKQSAQELDALDDKLFGRIDKKILALDGNPPPAGCKKLKGYKDRLLTLPAGARCMNNAGSASRAECIFDR